MTRVDLDAVERHWATVGNSACPECQNEALVAELRAAREVVAATRAWWGDDDCAGSAPVMRDVGAALVAYDRAIGQGGDS